MDGLLFWLSHRIVQGQANRVQRLKALGNAVVPQIAEELGRMIVAVEQAARAGG